MTIQCFQYSKVIIYIYIIFPKRILKLAVLSRKTPYTFRSQFKMTSSDDDIDPELKEGIKNIM